MTTACMLGQTTLKSTYNHPIELVCGREQLTNFVRMEVLIRFRCISPVLETRATFEPSAGADAFIEVSVVHCRLQEKLL